MRVFGKDEREGGLVGSEEGGEDEGEWWEDGFWGDLEFDVEVELGGEVVWGESNKALGVMWVRVEGCVGWLGGSGGDGSWCECDFGVFLNGP